VALGIAGAIGAVAVELCLRLRDDFGAGGAGGASASLRFSELMPFTSRKMAKAMMRKSMQVWMKLP